MTTNPFFSGRIPQGLYDRIEEYREQTGESKTEILIRALAQYVDYPLEGDAPPPIKQTFEEIFSRLAIIESKIANEGQLSQLSIDNNKQLSIDNVVTTESNVVELQSNDDSSNTREYIDAEAAKMIGCHETTSKRIREGKIKNSSYQPKIDELGLQPSENGWVGDVKLLQLIRR